MITVFMLACVLAAPSQESVVQVELEVGEATATRCGVVLRSGHVLTVLHSEAVTGAAIVSPDGRRCVSTGVLAMMRPPFVAVLRVDWAVGCERVKVA